MKNESNIDFNCNYTVLDVNINIYMEVLNTVLPCTNLNRNNVGHVLTILTAFYVCKQRISLYVILEEVY